MYNWLNQKKELQWRLQEGSRGNLCEGSEKCSAGF